MTKQNKKNVFVCLFVCSFVCLFVHLNKLQTEGQRQRESLSYDEVTLALPVTIEQLIVRSVATKPFLIATFHPLRDTYISRCIQNTGLWDVHVLKGLEGVVGDSCRNDNTIHAVDVGANLGFFTNALLAMGCVVTSFEMQEEMIQMVNLSVHLNHATNRFRPMHGAVASKAGTLQYSKTHSGNLGGVSVDVATGEGASNDKAVIEKWRLDVKLADVASIIVMKIDVEGYEYEALKGASGLFEQRKVENILLELSPKVSGVEQAAKMLHMLYGKGFTKVQELDFMPPEHYTTHALVTHPIKLGSMELATKYAQSIFDGGDNRKVGMTDVLLSLE